MKYFQLALIASTMISCTTPQKESYTQEQLYTKMSSGVVLIQNTYFHTIRWKGEEESDWAWEQEYYISVKDDFSCEIHGEIGDTKVDKHTTYGTGFLISNNGIIVTNSHVINPKIDTEQAYNALRTYIINQTEEWENQLKKVLDYKQTLESLLAYHLSAQEYMKYREELNECNHFIDTFNAVISTNLKRLKYKTYEVKIESQIKIAYNESEITLNNNWENCSVLKDIPNCDLGIIKIPNIKRVFWNTCIIKENPLWNIDCHDRFTKNGSLDPRVIRDIDNAMRKNGIRIPDDKFIFRLTDRENTNDEEVKLYMIGFNLGPNLASTNEGIKAQITQGHISQNTDSIKIMYSIPALQGSSGSPVVNQYGELVAVNFAGLSNTQGFNYGIKIERLKDILNDENVRHFLDNEQKDSN